MRAVSDSERKSQAEIVSPLMGWPVRWPVDDIRCVCVCVCVC